MKKWIMWPFLSMKNKIISTLIIISLFPLFTLYYFVDTVVEDTMQQQVINQLTSLRGEQQYAITDYLNSVIANIVIYTKDHHLAEDFKRINTVYNGDLQNESYKQAVSKIEHYYKHLVNNAEYYDFFFINQKGDVIFSVGKEADLGTNLLNGRWSQTNFAEAFRYGLKSETMTDYEYYSPSNEPAAFIAAPMFDSNGKELGVVAIQLSNSKITEIMRLQQPLGNTGYSFLVGKDYLMRSDDSLSKKDTPAVKQISNKGVQLAFGGVPNAGVFKDKNGDKIVGSYRSFKVNRIQWVVAVTMEYNDAFKVINEIKTVMFYVIVFNFIFLIILGTYFGKKLSNPLKLLNEQIKSIAYGNFHSQLQFELKDELGSIANYMNQVQKTVTNIVQELSDLAKKDPLTQIANRRALDEALMRLENETFAFCFIDIDFFKKYNDSYGHAAGDDCLKKIANTLELTVKPHEGFVARYGGEEFVVIIYNSTQAASITSKIHESVSKLALLHQMSTVSPYVTLSMGVATHQPLGEIRQTLEKADQALYKAKADGRNRIVFSEQ